MTESSPTPPGENIRQLAAAVDKAMQPAFDVATGDATRILEIENAAPGVFVAIDTAKTTGDPDDMSTAQNLWTAAAYTMQGNDHVTKAHKRS